MHTCMRMCIPTDFCEKKAYKSFYFSLPYSYIGTSIFVDLCGRLLDLHLELCWDKCLLDRLDLLDRLEFPGVDLELSIERHVKQVEL